MSQHESHADIIAEMRMGNPGPQPVAYVVGLPDEIIELEHSTMRKIRTKRVTITELANRLEAANRREVTEAATKAATSAVNLTKEKYRRLLADATKLRDALDLIQRKAEKLQATAPDDHMTMAGGLSIIRETARDALASLDTESEVKP